MATTTASITINSDITSNPITITKEMVMHKFQSNIGIEETTGLQAKKFAATTAVVIVENTEGTAAKASKVYMRNTGSSKETFFHLAINASAAADATTETIGRLYGGDWMLVPYEGAVNLTVAPSTANDMTLEYGLFYE